MLYWRFSGLNGFCFASLRKICYQLYRKSFSLDPTGHQSAVREADHATVGEKVSKRVSFSEQGDKTGEKTETIRNFYMMESTKADGKPNFMMGGEGEDVFEGLEDKDQFPTHNGGLVKQTSDASLIDKRRRLR